MFRLIARKPVPTVVIAARYGKTIIERKMYKCPSCGDVLNAGPDYKPNYCSKCGQHINFNSAVWEEDVERTIEQEEPQPAWLHSEPFELNFKPIGLDFNPEGGELFE